jgi:tetratricopeptide (TPR) repeat protein
LRLFFLSALVAACAAGAQTPLEQSVTLARQHRYSEAAKLLRTAAEPRDPSQRIAFHRLKAAIASGLNQPKTAAAEMRLALALAPADSSLALATAVAESQAGLVNDALQHAQIAARTAPAQALIGDLQERLGNLPAASAAYQTAISLAPSQESYRVAFAFLLIKHQDFRAAIDHLNASVPLFPGSASLPTLLGIAHYAAAETAEAQQSFEAALKVNPQFTPAYRCLAEVVLQSSAAPSAPISKLLCGWNDVVCGALELRAAREKGDRALEQRAIGLLKKSPASSAVGRCELARGYEWTGQLALARTEMEACVRLAPLPQNHYRLGLLYQKLGLTGKAHEQMELRAQTLRKMSEQTALGLNALQSMESSPAGKTAQ